MYDTFFLTMGERDSMTNLHRLQEKCSPIVIRDVKGFWEAHKACADVARTDFFYVVDADAWITDDFEFTYVAKEERVHVFRSINPVNGLRYGHGAVKLFPVSAFDRPKPEIDITTSLGGIIPINEISNETRFNTTEYNTWRSAFRECVKLSGKIIDNQIDIATNYRLTIWCNIFKHVPYYEQCLAGAKKGRAYGEANRNNIDALKLINDEQWLLGQYEKV